MSRKVDGFILRVAKANNKLDTTLYKQIIKRSKLVKSTISIREFKEAYHSPKTKPEHRALLLMSLFDSPELIKHKFDRWNMPPKLMMKVNQEEGKKHFNLVGFDFKKHDFKPVNLSILAKRDMNAWMPWGAKGSQITRALLTPNVHSQKVGLLIDELSIFLSAYADMLFTNIKANDPQKKYYGDSPIDGADDDESLKGKANTMGDISLNERKFLKHLEHMSQQLDNYEDLADAIGVDLMAIRVKGDILYNKTLNFAELDIANISPDAEEAMLYDIHELSKDLVWSILEASGELSKVDISSPRIYKLSQRANVPKFVDYNPEKLSRHTRRAKSGLVESITRIWGLLNN